ncbi:DNA-binding response regulator [Portibacter lacus]|uniref:DNA-binding response regulator n=1 Tax=Portibacter lacus TaxID=1099794 RepID=A0AA37SR69_9BACT|nr:DNA-binding response regulator [Portibacter lacus]
MVIEGLKLILADDARFVIAGEVNNGKEALEYLAENEIDILLMDINMPVLNGLETAKIVKKDFPDLKVIMLSMLNDSHLIKNLIEHGIRAYLMKNAGQKEIIETIIQVSEGKTVFENDLLLEIMNLKRARIKKKENSLFPKLSRREKEILALIVDEHTTAEIAKKLFISFGTVETHRRNMLNKLGLRNTAGLVRVAIEFDILNNDE